ncbi:acyltransferase family protein [Pseudomonas nunensis]|uniref:Acyltransferase n=1 Tax=Pseudomonas nunensis TaxID=2961896 RepID=A0ABY5EB93_9PSED|nr:acyltransferase [Pseudomonas nunensis]MCL5229103.1 acyltransferase [Pseudomonas nunensis]UTO12689.1 acyltransferase [Pseudomonas nunensis]
MNLKGQIDSLTSLRFFAAAMIVVGHGGSNSYFSYSINFVDVRNAVSFFFVLSGFILSHAYRNLDLNHGVRSFFAARVSRLYPSHIFTAILAVLLLSPIDSLYDFARAGVNILMLQSLVPLLPWHYSLNAVSWSISTEFFFYALFPFILPIAKKRPRLLALSSVLIVVVMIAAASLFNLSTIEAAGGVTAWGILYISPVTRLAEFMAGMVAYQAALKIQAGSNPWSSSKATWFEFLSLFFVVLSMSTFAWLSKNVLVNIAPQAGVWVLVAGSFISFSILISVFSVQRGALSSFLTWTPLVYLGKISFSLYMVHQLVIRCMYKWNGGSFEADWLVFYISYWSLSLICAAALFHLIEQPFHAPIKKFISGHRLGMRN